MSETSVMYFFLSSFWNFDTFFQPRDANRGVINATAHWRTYFGDILLGSNVNMIYECFGISSSSSWYVN